MNFFKELIDPNTKRRFSHFKNTKRAYWSFWLFLIIFIISLFANFLANNKPLIINYEGKFYFPIFKYYSEDTFYKNGNFARINYKELVKSDVYKQNKKNWAIFPIIKYGAYETIKSSDLKLDKSILLRIETKEKIANIDVLKNFKIYKSNGLKQLLGIEDKTLRNKKIEEVFEKNNKLKSLINGLEKRFSNIDSPILEIKSKKNNYKISLVAYKKRGRAPKKIRIYLRENNKITQSEKIKFAETGKVISNKKYWLTLSEKDQKTLMSKVDSFRQEHAINSEFDFGNFKIYASKNNVNFPYPPNQQHILGLDESGRDVLTVILYATRISLLFGLILVTTSTILGIIIGAIQGFFGGKVDILGQRFIEIWEALPFLFIIMFLGSVFGKGFLILLVIYAAFNWISLSYYVRADFLKLRKMQFVEAARVLGISRIKIIIYHILPNALSSVITLFPFGLVGAIFALSALDYLGFGLPPGTPSWGDLLAQAQVYPPGWWLVVFPSIALFTVTLLGVFIGEGLRAAFDPRNKNNLE